jgi:radical SAM protein with 4Fe4S-binding SPASM domain
VRSTELLERLGLAGPRPTPRGVHRFDGRGELAHHRFHLRVDASGKGVLLIDASKLLFLNGTALEYARCVLEGLPEKRAVRRMRSLYRGLAKRKAREHLGRMRGQLVDFVGGKEEVVRQVAARTPTVGADDLPAPYRMDLALTYRCQNDCGHCYNEDRPGTELSVEEWGRVLEALWKVGIPHIVFTGGEPTLYAGLRDLIAMSERLGQVTGLITNGRELRRPGYLRDLVSAGLDHVQVTLLSHRRTVHDELACSEGAWDETVEGIKAAVAEDLYVSTNTTILRRNIGDIEDTARFVIGLGVRNVAFNSVIRSGGGKSAEGVTHEELAPLLARLGDVAAEGGAKLIWYTPTPYCGLNPVNLGLGIKQCTACSINMAIEPDGTVLPCQSFYRPLGNILRDPWEAIWGHELCKAFRTRANMPARCKECALADVCGGGCPLSAEHGDYVCLDRHSSM